jgi:hypothetical protein
MALIPGTLPNDTCYGTPQDLLELFAQYLDVPAFALNSKVVFSNANPGSLTADVIWFDTGFVAPASATNPILKITVSGGFVDYIKNYITNAPVVTIVGADTVLILDASDSLKTKRGLVSDIIPGAGSITPAQLAQPFTIGTTQLTTSGTTIDFTGIPSWVKRITVMLKRVKFTSSSNFLIQIGSGSVTTTGYISDAWTANSANTNSTAGFLISAVRLTVAEFTGNVLICTHGSDTWVESHSVGGVGSYSSIGGGSITLGGSLDRVRLTSVTPDTFSGGSVNILYE